MIKKLIATMIIVLFTPALAFAWCDNCRGDCCACPGQAQCLDGYNSCEEACGGGSSYSPPVRDYAAEARAASEATGNAINDQGLQARINGDTDAAISYFQQALQYMPDNRVIQQNLATAINDKGNVAWKSHRFLEAINYYEQAVQAFPDDLVIQSNLTRCRADLEQREAAAREEEQQRIAYQEGNKVIVKNIERVVSNFSLNATSAVALAPASGKETAPDAFGAKKAAPDLQFGTPSEDLSEKTRNWFDNVGEAIFAKRPREAQLSEINSDPRMVAVDGQLSGLRAERDALASGQNDLIYQASAAAADPVRKQELEVLLSAKTQELQQKKEEIIKGEESKKKLHRVIKTEIEQKPLK